MKHLKRIGLTAALLVTLVAGFGVAPASAAPPTNDCTGTFVAHYTSGGGGFAELDLYWNATLKMNCAKMVHLGAAYHQPAYTSIDIWTCGTDVAGQPCGPISDNPPYHGENSGTFGIFAGPAWANGSGHCIYAVGLLTWGGHNYVIATAPNGTGSHC